MTVVLIMLLDCHLFVLRCFDRKKRFGACTYTHTQHTTSAAHCLIFIRHKIFYKINFLVSIVIY